jgi:hypothetical protein
MKKRKMVMNKWTGGAMLAGLSLMSLPAFAQDVESLDNGVSTPAPEEQTAEKSAWLPIKVTTGLSEQFSSDIDSGGSFSITRFKVGALVPVRLNDDLVLATSLRYGLDAYDFNSTPAPWDTINTLTAASILSWRVNETWTAYGGGFVKVSAESGADWGDGTTGGGLVGFNYKVDDDLSLGAGLAVVGQIEEDAKVLPLITAKWNYADYWRLDVGLTDVATLGYGAKLNWMFDKDVEFGLGAQFHRSRFRIETANDVGQEQATTIYIDGTWHATPKVDLNAYIGIAAGGQLRVDNSSGSKLFESNYDTTPIIGVDASVKF